MVKHVSDPALPLATMSLLAVASTGIALGLIRGRRGGEASDPKGWSAGDDGHCGDHDGSCEED